MPSSVPHSWPLNIAVCWGEIARHTCPIPLNGLTGLRCSQARCPMRSAKGAFTRQSCCQYGGMCSIEVESAREIAAVSKGLERCMEVVSRMSSILATRSSTPGTIKSTPGMHFVGSNNAMIGRPVSPMGTVLFSNSKRIIYLMALQWPVAGMCCLN